MGNRENFQKNKFRKEKQNEKSICDGFSAMHGRVFACRVRSRRREHGSRPREDGGQRVIHPRPMIRVIRSKSRMTMQRATLRAICS